jgi:hypothetical protein
MSFLDTLRVNIPAGLVSLSSVSPAVSRAIERRVPHHCVCLGDEASQSELVIPLLDPATKVLPIISSGPLPFLFQYL